MTYDLIIIGAGPAGITASIYASRKKLKFLVISSNEGGQTLWTRNIDNYAGYVLLSGLELTNKFSELIDKDLLSIKEGQTVSEVVKESGLFKVKTEKGVFEAKTVIAASGKTPKKLGIPGENEFLNKGVAYCATCDAPLFSGKDVVVAGGGVFALDSAIQLLPHANKITMINSDKAFTAPPVMVEKVKNNPKVEIYHKSSLKEIYGSMFVEKVKADLEGAVKEINAEGVFIETGSIISSEFARDVLKNENSEILIDSKCRTNVEGFFAAGDCTELPAKQLIIACGEGAKAAISAFNYLSMNKNV